MGQEWLTQTEEILRLAGFRTEAGYPGDRAMALTDTVAAVNLWAVDETQVREILITILTPRKLGLEVCQTRAAEAVRALAADGNRWNFERWRYETGIDCWVIEIHGILAEERGQELSLGYTVEIGDVQQIGVTDFLAEQVLDRRMIYPHWGSQPSGAIPGKMGWILKLTQMLDEELEISGLEEPFFVTVRRGDERQSYSPCYLQSYSSRQKQDGIEVVRGFFALGREVT